MTNKLSTGQPPPPHLEKIQKNSNFFSWNPPLEEWLYTWEKWISCTYGVLPMYTWQLQRIKKEIQMKWSVKSKRTIEEKRANQWSWMLVEGTRPENVAGLAANPPHTLQIHSFLYSLQFLFFKHTYDLISVTILVSTLSPIFVQFFLYITIYDFLSALLFHIKC